MAVVSRLRGLGTVEAEYLNSPLIDKSSLAIRKYLSAGQPSVFSVIKASQASRSWSNQIRFGLLLSFHGVVPSRQVEGSIDKINIILVVVG